MNAATGRSLADAVTQNLNELVDQQALANSSSGTPSGSGGLGGGAQLGGPRMNANGPGAGGAATGALSSGAVPTGRLRTSEHEGLKPTSANAYSYSTDEGSAFANVVVPIPGTVLGGQMKFGALAGANRVALDLKSNVHAALNPDQFANGANESFLTGGTLQWSSGGTYAVASVIGFWGETKLVDSVDDCSPCNVHRYRFNTSGFIGTGSAGQVFNLAGPSGPNLDVRGSVSYIENTGDSFRTHHDYIQKYAFSTWAGTLGATLFSNVEMHNGGLLRPYIQAQIRQEWRYRSVLDVTATLGADPSLAGTFRTDQSHTYGGLTAGVTYNLDRLTLGAAAYTEYSGDERSLGGRFGATWLLGGEGARTTRVSERPIASPVHWSGFYFGANAGVASADISMTNLGPSDFIDFFGQVGGSDTITPRGWLAGGQVGYNWQVGSIVMGLEGAWSGASLRDEKVGTVPGGSEKDHWMAETSQIYSISGRLGLAAGNWLPYVKGGFAGASIETNMVRPAEPNFISSSNNWHNGWMVGGGVEYMFAPNWTIGLEYDRYMFESKNVSAIRTGDPNNGGGIEDRWTVKPDDVHALSTRLNLKFN